MNAPAVSVPLSSLTQKTKYWYTFYATNALGAEAQPPGVAPGGLGQLRDLHPPTRGRGQALKQPAERAADPVAALTPRQRQVLQLLAEGRSAKKIASQLSISPRTVEFHKYQLMEALGVHTNAELVHFALKHGIVEL